MNGDQLMAKLLKEEGDLQVVMPNTMRVVVDVDVNGLRDTFVEHLRK